MVVCKLQSGIFTEILIIELVRYYWSRDALISRKTTQLGRKNSE